jgi:glucose-6-phosphate isomerase
MMETDRGDAYHLGSSTEPFGQILSDWASADGTNRLWRKDRTLWTGNDEDRWLAWLDGIEVHREGIGAIDALVEDVREQGLTDVLVLGMGGSSLCPEVVSETFGEVEGYPRLHVLDSTVPDQVRRFRDRLDLSKTLVVVASKSGSTVEPNVLLDYFADELRGSVDEPGRHIVAVTDPGSALEQRAATQGFRAVLGGVPEIGGRFSALSNFGLLPAGLAGVDLDKYLNRATEMSSACREADENPGVLLGAALGAALADGRDKVTLVVSPQLWGIGAWVEQLVAESTGKGGTGLCPIDQEPVLSAEQYGDDRVFVYLRLETGADTEQDRFVAGLSDAGHPTVTLRLADVYDLGAEFFRWEFATAVVGSMMRINPFDQPNVQESKDITASLLASVEDHGELTEPEPAGDIGNLTVTSSLRGESPEDVVRQLLASIAPGDYFAISAYCDRTRQAQETFQRLRHRIASARGVATTLGYGPRFLHSTGQLHKGGANKGVFLQITTPSDKDLKIPGKVATFGVLSRAQALGDYQALVDRGRRVLRLDLRSSLAEGLPEVERVIIDALG